jgi:xylose isomerase
MTCFPTVQPIRYEGEHSKNPLAYRYFDAHKKVLGKTMQEHLRLAVCYWHNFCWGGNDAFGGPTRQTPWHDNDPLKTAEKKCDALFELVTKLGIPYFCFHDRDVAPEGATFAESQKHFEHILNKIERKMSDTGVKLLWGTANLFSHPRYLAGAATNPNPEVFAYAAAQVKSALEATHRLHGANYVLWGGREGYDSLLNTNLKQELDQFARFLSLVVEHKHKIGFKGLLLIEPKPCEPTKHQYDYDTATVYGFLKKYGLEKEFKVNIEANHATLAGHSFEHEVATACALDLFGSIDANRGDPQNGWDTDQFPNSVEELTLVMYRILQHGGFTSGGFNFDTKVRRQSINVEDLFYGHIGGIDVLAKSLLNAAKLLEDKVLDQVVQQRYQGWSQSLGQQVLSGKLTLEQLQQHVLNHNLDPESVSGQQELCENIVRRYC